MSRYYNDDGFDEFEVDDDELYHFGIKGQKWGLRRFQNEDGTLTPEGKMRYLKGDSSVTRRVKNDWNSMSDKEFKAKYRTSKNTYLKRVRKYGDPYMNSPLAKTGKKLNALRNRRPYSDKAAKEELDLIKKDNGKIVKFDKKTAVKALAGLAVTAAGAAAIYKMMNKNGPTGDSLQRNFSDAFDIPDLASSRLEYMRNEANKKAEANGVRPVQSMRDEDSLARNFSDAFDLRKPDRVTPDSLQKNFSNAFNQPKTAPRRPDRVTPDSLQKNFSNAFNQPKTAPRRPDRVTPDSLQKNFSNAFNQNRSSGTSVNRNHSSGTSVNQNRSSGTSVNRNHSSGTSVNQNRSAEKQFQDSIKTARAAGVPEDKILKTKDDIDNYFTGGSRGGSANQNSSKTVNNMSQEEFDKAISDPTLTLNLSTGRFEKKKK